MFGKVLFFIFMVSSFVFANTATLKELDDKFEALVLKDIKTGEVIFSSNNEKKIRPASLTKIMTTILALESGKMNDIVTITKEMTNAEPSKAGFLEGEKFYLRDLVKSAMIQSANDSARTIGLFLGGSIENFAKMMNEKAIKIGMTNTNFTNPCGFDIGNHTTTAKDLLKLTEYAIKNNNFNLMAQMKVFEFTPVNSSKKYIAKNHNKLLNKYKYAVGVKTGYTKKAGPCLIARAKHQDKDMLLIMLDSRADRWANAAKIFDEFMGLSGAVGVVKNVSSVDSVGSLAKAKYKTSNLKSANQARVAKNAKQNTKSLSKKYIKSKRIQKN